MEFELFLILAWYICGSASLAGVSKLCLMLAVGQVEK